MTIPEPLATFLHRGEAVAVAALASILRVGGFRWLKISYPHRIGHLVLEADSFLCDRMLSGSVPRRFVVIEPDEGFANAIVADYLPRYLIVVRRSRIAGLLRRAFEREGLIEDTAPYAVAMYETARCFEVYRRWGDRPPLFELTPADRQHARLGVPADAWFVCVHARGGSYSPSDEFAHSYRNVPIVDYSLAMRRITAGGWCIGMGDPNVEPMPPQVQCVDYALSAERSAARRRALGELPLLSVLLLGTL